jgi:NhaP-type Na+/H+ or K+/H+ antiporter
MMGLALSLVKTKLNKKERLFCALAYTPKATVQAALGTVPLAMGLACGEIVLTVAVISILITGPLGAICVDNLYKKLLSK